MASTTSFGDTNAGFQAGIINGPVSATFHLPTKQLETPLLPSIVIPFARDPDFVERGTILDQVDRICAAPGARAALVGLGGVGKSQLAIEHAYRTRARSSETWVFWVHASNAARFEQSFRDIADRAKIAERRDPQANIFKLVHDWLCDCTQQWLLILDNVDDARFLLDVRADREGQATINNLIGAARPLREYLPYCERGSILITTRSKEAALKLAEQRNVLNIEPMDKIEGLSLFRKKLGAQEDSSDIAELAVALEHMPLAIVQAAAYISQRAPRYSIAQYLEQFRRSDSEKTILLNYEAGQLRRDREAKNSILIAWQISFEHLRQNQPSAANLLSLMSFFDRQGIPEALIHGGQGALKRRQGATRRRLKQIFGRSKSKDRIQGERKERDGHGMDFEDDIVALRNLCFISVNADGCSFEMHRLVQLATRRWLTINGKLEQWKQHFISNLCGAFPTGDYENWTVCQALYAHAKAAAEQRPKDERALTEWATVLYRAAWFADRKGYVSDADILSTKAMEARKKVLGPEHEDTICSVSMVGSAYSLGCRWGDAETLFMQVMETRRAKFGADHLDTLASMHNLALLYRSQGRWDEAETLLVQVMETRRAKLGADHLDTLASMHDLASIYRNQGRWDEAERQFMQVMETRRAKLGADHLDTLASMHDLASIYLNQGRWDEAERLLVQAIEIRKTKLGVDHPQTLISTTNLALTYSGQGRWDDAEKLFVQVIESLKTKLGVHHPATLTSMNNLASTYLNQGRWDEAETLFIQVIETSKTKLGANHPTTLTSTHNLALTWKAQGRTADAVALMSQCLQQRQQVLKAVHPDIQASLEVLEQWKME